jgi:hypothetical protein
MSLHIGSSFTRPLALASAALVMHIGAATAADSKGDVQQQVREVLTGTTTSHFAPQSEPRDARVATRAVDSQELVRQILLGTTTGASGKPETQKRQVAFDDVQAAVRQVLLGQRHARDAS